MFLLKPSTEGEKRYENHRHKCAISQWASESQEHPPCGYQSSSVRDMPPVFESHLEPRPYAIFGRLACMGKWNGQGSDPQYHGGPIPRRAEWNSMMHMNAQAQSVTKIKRPATYDGTSSWEDYLVQFQMIEEINNWDSQTKALELATSLQGQAMGVLTNRDPEQRESYSNWSQLYQQGSNLPIQQKYSERSSRVMFVERQSHSQS